MDKIPRSDADDVASLRAKIKELEGSLEVVEAARDLDDIGKAKMHFATRAMAVGLSVLVAVQSLFAVFDRPGPIQGTFAWVLLAYAALYLVGFVIQLGMHHKRKLEIQAEVSLKGTKVKVSAGDAPRAPK